jgi:hypothetical protein
MAFLAVASIGMFSNFNCQDSSGRAGDVDPSYDGRADTSGGCFVGKHYGVGSIQDAFATSVASARRPRIVHHSLIPCVAVMTGFRGRCTYE